MVERVCENCKKYPKCADYDIVEKVLRAIRRPEGFWFEKKETPMIKAGIAQLCRNWEE